MRRPLNRISIEGFKSIRALEDFPLGPLNVLIGPNGAGKSNLVDFFRMLRAMSEEGLAGFVHIMGGADGFFFNGPKETPQIKAHLVFGPNEYRFVLEPTAANELMVKNESTLYTDGQFSSGWKHHGGGRRESRLKSWKDERSSWKDAPSMNAYVYGAASSWIVYHFHDTSNMAPMRREQSIHDYRELNPDASNIAAFLYHLMEEDRSLYQRIRETIQLIAPFFDDFLLEPTKKGKEEKIHLQWRQKGSSFPFQPYHLSDGTIRFICLTTALLQPNPPSTMLVDEPELGMHPFALEVLASLFREASEWTQVIVSTQSAALLNHFEPEETIVVDRESGASRFRRLESESLEEWLGEFALGELWQKNVLDGIPSHE